MSEPAWLAGKRAAALETYTALPVPTQPRGGVAVHQPARLRPRRLRRPHPGTLDARRRCAGGAVVHDAWRRRSPTQPELVERYLGTVVPDGEKFAAGERRPLARRRAPARARPASTVEAPLRAIVELTDEGSALYHRVLIVLERGAQATFVEEFRSEVPGYLNGVVELDRRRRGPPRVRHDPAPPLRDAPVRHAPRHGRPRRRARLGRGGARRRRAPSRAWRATWPARARTSR